MPPACPVDEKGRQGIGQPGDQENGPGVGPAAGSEKRSQQDERVCRNRREEILQRSPGAKDEVE
jgi:hypothetical protein